MEPERLKVLAVDDDPGTCKVVSIFLTGEGFDVTCAMNGMDAVRLAKQDSPDIIILDVEMPPGIDGAEACRRIRSDPDIPRMPIIFLTARAHLEAMEAALEDEAQAYILKPLSTFDLLEKINEVLGREQRIDPFHGADFSPR